MDENQATGGLLKDIKLYTMPAIALATFLGGPLAAGILAGN